MLKLDNLGYESWQTVYYQRTTVIATELLLIVALRKYKKFNVQMPMQALLMCWHSYISTSGSSSKLASHAIALSVFLSPALLIIDHLHFQYNAFLYGLLILSLVFLRKQSTMLLGGVLFAALLCFKHIYLYLAPAYFAYLLRVYCLQPESILYIRFRNFFKLAVAISGVLAVSFGPFLYWGQLEQLLARLFPFSRGLCHAYWAPNIWAMYSFLDRILLTRKNITLQQIEKMLSNLVAPGLGLHFDDSALEGATRGLIGVSSFAVLPNISPGMTFMLTVFFQMVVALLTPKQTFN